MRLQILDLARNDLIEGFHFYEDKGKGLGDYFLVNVYSDIESLKIIRRRPSEGVPRIPPRAFEEIPIRDLLHG